MKQIKKDRWTEDEVTALPSGERDDFERKSGAFLTDPEFEKKLAKALSALANSSGGHILLGVADNGVLDGVPKLKGRTSAKEWLEQKIPWLLSYPLQDFRVHEVDPSAPSQIPLANVVIVIDVGDSPHAPHQETSTKLYYHRQGGHSVPASHVYLEYLRSREHFPTREIVRAWLDYVLNPLLYTVLQEQQYLILMHWGWDRRAGQLNGLQHIGCRDTYSGNQEQFLEAYPDIQATIDEHDLAINKLNTRCAEMFRVIKDSEFLLNRYNESASSGSLKIIRECYPDSLSGYDADETTLQRMFDYSSTLEDRLAEITEYIVNNVGEIDLSINVAPFWNTQKDRFLQLAHWPPLSEYRRLADTAREELLGRLESLIVLVKKTRLEISRTHGVPIEVQVKS